MLASTDSAFSAIEAPILALLTAKKQLRPFGSLHAKTLNSAANRQFLPLESKVVAIYAEFFRPVTHKERLAPECSHLFKHNPPPCRAEDFFVPVRLSRIM
jgi:hypothetical protein